MRSSNGLIIQGYLALQRIMYPEEPWIRKPFYLPESNSLFEVSVFYYACFQYIIMFSNHKAFHGTKVV